MLKLTDTIIRPSAFGTTRGLIILDRDGVLIKDTNYPCHYHEQHINLPLVQLLAELRLSGYRFGFASNQGGIGLGYYQWAEYQHLTTRLDRFMHHHGAAPDFWLACATHPQATQPEYRAPHSWRKPGPGMLLHILAHLRLQSSQALFIGDRHTDMLAASHAGVTGLRYSGWPDQCTDDRQDIITLHTLRQKLL